MYRIVAICEDKNLAKCLSALRGLAAIPDTPQEVVNAKLNGGGKLQAITNGEANDMFKQWVKGEGLKEVRPGDLKTFCRHINRSEASYSVLLTALTKANILAKRARKEGNTRWYKVMV